ncbi:MAG: YgeY family selenium metabolism-linked hydrolase [Thermotogaceae bacterium]|nr:YgeY family selenium metabolism-linked hydrolase [Thermotogaceae bacterium]
MKEALKLAEKYREDLVKFMSALIKAKSLSGQEKAVVEVIGNEMEKVGFDEVKVDGLGNIIGRIGNGKTKIAMDAHIDTVDVGNPALWNRDPFSGDWDDEWVYGRGASDQKAGMCSMVYGMKILKELGLLDDFTVYVTGTVMEEDCDGMCWRYIIEEDKLKPDFVVITEPTSLKIYRGHRGRIEFKIRTTGISAHASAPERGDNAVYKMSRIALEIEKLNERLRVDPFLGKGTIVVSQIESVSPSVNAVPDECTIHIDRRLTAGETKESAFKEIKDVFKRAGVEDAEIIELTYNGKAYTGEEYSMEKYFPTWVMDEDSLVVQAAKNTYISVFDDKPVIDKWTFSTNGVVTAGVYNIPTVGFGPGDEKYAHAPNEKVKIEHLVKAAAFYAVFPKILVGMMNK